MGQGGVDDAYGDGDDIGGGCDGSIAYAVCGNDGIVGSRKADGCAKHGIDDVLGEREQEWQSHIEIEDVHAGVQG